MKKYFIIWILFLLLLALFSFTAFNSEKEKNSAAMINQDLIQVKEFEVSTNLSDSSTTAKGNVYVQKLQDQTRITIVASVVIGENDWGGISFYIPKGWTISSALSSYPDGSSSNATSNNATIWNTADTESKWKSYVEIGRSQTQAPTSGGTGTVFLELTSDENPSISDNFSLLVSVGSEIKDGVPIVGTASTLVKLDIGPAERV